MAVTGHDVPVRIGILGFGAGGDYFHAPFIEAARGIELAGVVARSPETRQRLAQRFPGVAAYESLAAMVAAERAGAGLDAVTITTPPATRRDLVLEALAAGLHVVADKPFAPDAAGARDLAEAARRHGLKLSVFHNRRWDADIRTLRALLVAGRLPGVSRFHSSMDLAQTSPMQGGPAGGLLCDLGSHLVDQALWLFGPPQRVYAAVENVPTAQGETDGSFVITLTHRGGVTSVLSGSKLNHLQDRELRVYAQGCSYQARSSDVQARESRAGRRPVQDRAAWGFEPESAWGTLHTAAGAEAIPSEQGDYCDYYEQFARAIRADAAVPVCADEAVAVLEVIDAARAGAHSGRAVNLS